jgi:MFS family permease
VAASVAESSPSKIALTRNQVRGFWAAWGGWVLDGMDSFIYALVLVPALQELLPKSGIPNTPANVGSYGALLFALFIVGWGVALVWGPIADRFGRARTLMFTILFFSVFTLLAALSTGVWTLGIFRFLAGVGIGGEWSTGATFVSEEWPESRRTMGAALMHTGYYFGFFLAALANYFIGSRFGWRYMFLVGGAPALLVAFNYNRLKEPGRWERKQRVLGQKWTLQRFFLAIFSPQYRSRTIVNAILLLISTVGLWGGSVYVPAAITYLASNAGYSRAEGARLASYGTALLSIGTILGALVVPFVSNRLGRKINQAIFYAIMGLSIWLAFGYVFYMRANALPWFMVLVFFLGLGGANFTVYSFWIPEQYGTECRASALAFVSNVGRFVAAGFTFLVGAGIQHYQTLGTPIALTAIAFAIGILLLPLGVETKGQLLPS